MLRLLGRAFAVGKSPDPHLVKIAGSKTVEELFTYLSLIQSPLSLSQQTLSLKMISRFIRETPKNEIAFSKPLYLQMRKDLVARFGEMTASQTLDVLFWLRVCRQNGKHELSLENISDFLIRVESICRSKGYTPQGLTSVYLNLILLNRPSILVEETLESTLNSSKIGFIELKQILVGIKNSNHVRKSLAMRILAVLNEYELQDLPFGRLTEIYRLLPSIEVRDISLMVFQIFDRFAESLKTKMPTATNHELMDFIEGYRDDIQRNLFLLKDATQLATQRISSNSFTNQDTLTLYEIVSDLKPNLWVDFSPKPLLERLHMRVMNITHLTEADANVLTNVSLKVNIPVTDLIKSQLCQLNKVETLKIVGEGRVLPAEKTLIKNVRDRIPSMSVADLIYTMTCLNSSKNGDVRALFSNLFASLSLAIKPEPDIIRSYIIQSSNCSSDLLSALRPLTLKVFTILPEVIANNSDRFFLIYKTLNLSIGVEREWQEMISACRDYIQPAEILKIIRLTQETDAFAPTMRLLSTLSKSLTDETILHSSKFLTHATNSKMIDRYFRLINTINPASCLTESFRYNMKRLFHAIRQHPKACNPLLEGIREYLLSKS